jgi:hypothetical protein
MNFFIIPSGPFSRFGGGLKSNPSGLGSRYRSGRSPDWLKFKNPDAPGGEA